MLSWDLVCMLKEMRGLGLKDLRLFNMVLLGRQIWHIINNMDTLCYKVLSSKFFSDGDLLRPKHVDKPSFAWSSMCITGKKLEAGFG